MLAQGGGGRRGGGGHRVIWQRVVHRGAGRQMARPVPGVQTHGLHVAMVGGVGGSGVLGAGRTVDGRRTWRVVQGQRRCDTCAGGAAEAGSEFRGPLR